jgi:carbamoyl-phosphate synthase small subunit
MFLENKILGLKFKNLWTVKESKIKIFKILKKEYNKINMKAKLVLKDGSFFNGISFGGKLSVSGEAVFNTSMVGYTEALTDPSYFGQILIFTYPLIGNYGVSFSEFESKKIQVKGLVISDISLKYSHFSARIKLNDWLRNENIPGIYGVDTRALTKKLREKGTMLAKILNGKEIDFYDPNQEDLLKYVSTKKIIKYGLGNLKILLLDCGVKNSILRNLLRNNVRIIRVPYDINISKFDYDGLVISNGPGDPEKYQKTIKNVKEALKKNKPIFGICLGCQILALASGGKTYKLKYGHRSQNQPCQEIKTKKCFITSQNHGFAVDINSLGKDWRPWFLNINDGTLEGFYHFKKPFFAVQFHPEGGPGPLDTKFLFNDFLNICQKLKKH